MWQRYGFRKPQHLEKPIPIGLLISFIAPIISYGNFLWFAILESEVEGTSARASKRHGIYRYTEITDIHIALILSAGLVSNLVIATIAYLINLPELGKLSIYYAVYSLLPLGSLDGTKIFFGSRILWFALLIISLIFLGYALYLP